MAVDEHQPVRRLLLVGPPGSGKGTQAGFLSAELGVPAISTGEILRAAVAAGTELGQKVQSIMSSGSLVDDETMGGIVKLRLVESDAQHGFLLDGYPRTLAQAELLDQILAELGASLERVIVLEVPHDELVRRAIARQRADDKVDVINERLRVYQAQTSQLVSYYEPRDILSRVDGFQPVEAVSAAILGVLARQGSAWAPVTKELQR